MSGYQVGDKKVIAKNRERGLHQDKVDTGMIWIAVVGVLTLLRSWMYFSAVSDYPFYAEVQTILRIMGGVELFMAIGYFVLAWFGDKFPVLAASLALTMFLGTMGFYWFINPNSLASGLILKFFILSGLIKAITSARALNQ